MQHRLCWSFMELAGWTWNKLNTANQLGMPFSEETITESLLFKLAQKHGNSGLRITAYTKAEEGTGTLTTDKQPTGADWAFCFMDSKNNNITLHIQAKRMYPKGKYDGLDPKKNQHKNLMEYAKNNNAHPLYVFYNHDKLNVQNIDHSRYFCPCCFIEPQEVFGCTFSHANDVQSDDPSKILMLPWHYLVCDYCRYRGTDNSSLPARVAAALSRKPSKFKVLNSEYLPKWVDLVLNHKTSEEPKKQEELSKLDQILAEQGLHRVVIFKDVEN